MKVTALKQKISLKKPKKVTILGSTGSIGKNTIDLIRQHPESFEVEALTANNNVELLAEQAKNLNAKSAVITNELLYRELKERLAGTDIEVAAGEKATEQAASRKADFVMSAIIGAAGLNPTIKAIEQGATIGMANKECLVCAGDLINKYVKKNQATLIPVDSEHNSIFQIFDYKNVDKIEKITLTASGGPFLNHPRNTLKDITPKEAMKHPNWTMGAKISVDSATMMNKGLEYIEAYNLFPLERSQIDILIHPESVIHGLISYKDGSVMAGMSYPDMRVPISYALGWPERINNNSKKLNLAETGKLSFFKPDENQFPALRLAHYALEKGGTSPTILNAANEEAVKSFLSGEIGFLDITNLVKECLEKISSTVIRSIDDIISADREARERARNIIKNKR